MSLLSSQTTGLAPVQNQTLRQAIQPDEVDGIEIDIGNVAKKALASLVLVATNSVLTVSVAVMKLTGITLISSFAIGWLTKPLHAVNMAVAKHAFKPFHAWAEMLSQENTRIIEAEKVIKFKNNKLFFNLNNFKIRAFDSLKAVVAPVSLGLSITNAALWLAVKPLWLAMFVPGWLADTILLLPFAINKGIGHFTYAPLKVISDKMLALQCTWVNESLGGKKRI